jgi:hypothetical protein
MNISTRGKIGSDFRQAKNPALRKSYPAGLTFDDSRESDQSPIPINKRELEEIFEDDKSRSGALNKFVGGPWKSWSEKVLPLYKTTVLYD